MILRIEKKKLKSVFLIMLIMTAIVSPVLAIPDSYEDYKIYINTTLGDEVIYYPFYEGTGTTAVDIGLDSNDLTGMDNNWMTGVFDNAMILTAGGNTPVTSNFQSYTTELSFGAWRYNINEQTGGNGIRKRKAGGTDDFEIFFWYSPNRVECNAVDDNEVRLTSGIYTSIDNNWEHIFCVVNETSVCMFINGIEYSCGFNDSWTGTLRNEVNDIEFQDYINNPIDEFRIYNRTLTDEEIKLIAFGINCSSPTVIYDNSTNQYHTYSYNTDFNLTFCAYDGDDELTPQPLKFTCEDCGITDEHMRLNENNCSYITLKDNTTYESWNYSFFVEDNFNNEVNLSDMLFSIDEPTFAYWNWVENIKSNQFLQSINNSVTNFKCIVGLYNSTSDTCLAVLERIVNNTLDLDQHEYRTIKLKEFVRTKMNEGSCEYIQNINSTEEAIWVFQPLNKSEGDMTDIIEHNWRVGWVSTKFFFNWLFCALTTKFWSWSWG